ncbi:class I SAM-dependent methyltransferase [Alphaproteobacteria bacterium]|nr:class I SAM-dependent methyltransferase [Alphaproteobacteria bacterium]
MNDTMDFQPTPLTHNDYDFQVKPAASLRNLALVALLGGFIPDERLLYPEKGDGLQVADLGGGPGFLANSLAFSYPGTHFHTVDHNPELSQSAESLKNSFGHSNVSVHHGSIDSFNAANAGPWDVAMSVDTYGQMVEADRPSVWDTVDNVKDGGLVLFSYNCAVFNAQFDPFREFLKVFATTQGNQPIEQTKSALHLMHELVGEEAGYFSQMLIADRHKRSSGAGARKVFQEFMNVEWDSFYAHDIMPEFLGRSFRMCGDAAHLNNAKAQALPRTMVERLNRYPNRIISETLYDFSVNRSHRTDLYIKNGEKQSHADIVAFWADAKIMVRPKRENIKMKLKFRLNENLRLNPAKFDPLLNALAAGPMKLGDLRKVFPDGPEGDTEILDVVRIGHALGYINLYHGEDLFDDPDQAVLDYDRGMTGWLEETKAPAHHLLLPNFGEFRAVQPGLYALAVSAREGGDDNLEERAASLLQDIIKAQSEAGLVDGDGMIDDALDRIQRLRARFEQNLRPVLVRGGYFRIW